MNRTIRIMAVAVVALSLLVASCARMPSEKRTATIIHKYFDKYGKKFPETPFGKSKVGQVDILGRQEIHKHLVAVESFVTLKDSTVERINATIKRTPLGWRFVSWENATNLSSPSASSQ